jgi:hypothetical protein
LFDLEMDEEMDEEEAMKNAMRVEDYSKEEIEED